MSEPRPYLSEAGIPESYRADIDGLRAIAVLAVVGFHAFPGRIQGGFVGVDIFFVISGFLISKFIFKALDQKSFNFIDFYSRRVRRLFPALSLILLSCLVAGWFLELPKEYAQLGKHVSTGAAFVSNLTLWQEAGYFDPVSHSKPLLHLWSLGIEEQFYIFYPLVLYLIGHLSKARGRPLLLLTLASFVLSVFQIGADTSAAFYSPLTRFWELSVGGLLVLAQSHHDLAKCSLSRLVKNSMSIIGLAAIVLSLVLLSPNSVFPGWWAILPVGGTAALLWAGSDAIINKHLLSHRALVLVGLLSYPLYLWHWPLLTFAQIDASEPLNRSIRVAIVLISMFAAWVTYKYVEQPIRRRQLSVGLTTTLLTAIASIGLAGLIIYLLQGIPSRMPPIIQQLSAIEFDHSIQTRVGTCFLVDGQTAKDFSKCNDNPVEGRQFALLIGDSHASHLYPGLRKRFGEKVNIIQRTAGGCPPIFDVESRSMGGRLCDEVIQYAKRWVSQNKPQIVILSANWLFYESRDLSQTVASLRSSGVEKIVVVGPVPQWHDSLLKQIYRHYRESQQPAVPRKMSLGLNPQVVQVDEQIAMTAASLSIDYISPRQLLCDEQGCLTRYGESLDTLMTWDYGHLTNGASQYLVSKFADIVGQPNQ
jgi:peptidoglycan/LPS O-acetylase OafA/YrhL